MQSQSSSTAPDGAWSIDQALAVAFLEYVPDNIYFKDRESRFIACSRSQLRVFNLSPMEDTIGKTDFDFFDEAHARPAPEAEQQVRRPGQPMLGKLEEATWPD